MTSTETQARKTIEIWAGRIGELAVEYTQSTADHFGKDVIHNLDKILDLKLSDKDRGIVEAVQTLVQRNVMNKDLMSLYFSHANNYL
jgi:hypothetical protein